MQTLQQQRVKHALEQIQKFSNDKDMSKKILSRTAELPYMIRSNGLAQAAGFYKSKGQSKDDTDGYGLVYKALQDWLCNQKKIFSESSDDLIKCITLNDMQTYLVACAEAEEYTYHLKTIAKAYL